MTEVLHVVEVYLDYKRGKIPSWAVKSDRLVVRAPSSWGKGVGVLLTDSEGCKRGALHFDSVDELVRLSEQLYHMTLDLRNVVTMYGSANWVVQRLDLHERRKYPIGELLPELQDAVKRARAEAMSDE